MSFWEAPSGHLTIEHMGGYVNMADDRMKNDDLQRNMGGAKDNEGQNPGQQSPGRTGQQGHEGGGKQAGGYGGGQQGNKGTNERDLRTTISAPANTGLADRDAAARIANSWSLSSFLL